MKLSDIVELAKAGYKPADIFKLLEYVENSPAIKEAAPDITPDDVPTATKEPEQVPLVEKKEEPKTVEKTAEDILNDLIT